MELLGQVFQSMADSSKTISLGPKIPSGIDALPENERLLFVKILRFLDDRYTNNCDQSCSTLTSKIEWESVRSYLISENLEHSTISASDCRRIWNQALYDTPDDCESEEVGTVHNFPNCCH